MMRSAARLTYEQAQAARDGTPDERPRRCSTRLGPLYGAYRALLGGARRARRARPRPAGAAGHPGRRRQGRSAIEPRERLDSHRLIEEFMVAGQRRRRRGAGAAPHALPLPRPRPPVATRSWRRCASSSTPSASPCRGRPGLQPARLQPRAASRSRGKPACAAGQRDRAAQPDPGGLQPRQYRPFRPGAGALRPFHLADPPLCRPARAPRADLRPGLGDGGLPETEAAASPIPASTLRHRTPRRRGRTRRRRPLPRGLHGRSYRRGVRLHAFPG